MTYEESALLVINNLWSHDGMEGNKSVKYITAIIVNQTSSLLTVKYENNIITTPLIQQSSCFLRHVLIINHCY